MKHTATITQAGSVGYLQAAPAAGYLVQCPHGCNLGTSAHAPDRAAAERRVELHELATDLRRDSFTGYPAPELQGPPADPDRGTAANDPADAGRDSSWIAPPRELGRRDTW